MEHRTVSPDVPAAPDSWLLDLGAGVSVDFEPDSDLDNDRGLPLHGSLPQRANSAMQGMATYERCQSTATTSDRSALYLRLRTLIGLMLGLGTRTTCSGGRMGADHPIAWCQQDIGSGRCWYTGMGHTSDSYREPLFLQHILGGIEMAVGVARFNCSPQH